MCVFAIPVLYLDGNYGDTILNLKRLLAHVSALFVHVNAWVQCNYVNNDATSSTATGCGVERPGTLASTAAATTVVKAAALTAKTQM